jgi:hypothetical protein
MQIHSIGIDLGKTTLHLVCEASEPCRRVTGQPSITFSSTSLTSRWIAARETSLHGRSGSSRCIRWPDHIVLAGIVTVVIGG